MRLCGYVAVSWILRLCLYSGGAGICAALILRGLWFDDLWMTVSGAFGGIILFDSVFFAVYRRNLEKFQDSLGRSILLLEEASVQLDVLSEDNCNLKRALDKERT